MKIFDDRIVLNRFCDMHFHGRGCSSSVDLDADSSLEALDLMNDVVPIEGYFSSYCLFMPNVLGHIKNSKEAADYMRSIRVLMSKNDSFRPLATLYLSKDISVDDILRTEDMEWLPAMKYYPDGMTTGSDSGTKNLSSLYHVFEAMEKIDKVLCIHPEVSDMSMETYDRERAFIPQIEEAVKRFPNLRIVCEHASDMETVDFVRGISSGKVAASLTMHHACGNTNLKNEGSIRYGLDDDRFGSGGPCVDHFCKPCNKAEIHRRAILEAMTSGDPRFFYGSDSAAHLPGKKHSYASCCGVFTADIGPLALAHSFDLMGKLGRLESFSSTNAMNFYRLTDPGERITLYRKEFVIPDSYGRCELVPFGRGTSLPWSY